MNKEDKKARLSFNLCLDRTDQRTEAVVSVEEGAHVQYSGYGCNETMALSELVSVLDDKITVLQKAKDLCVKKRKDFELQQYGLPGDVKNALQHVIFGIEPDGHYPRRASVRDYTIFKQFARGECYVYDIDKWQPGVYATKDNEDVPGVVGKVTALKAVHTDTFEMDTVTKGIMISGAVEPMNLSHDHPYVDLDLSVDTLKHTLIITQTNDGTWLDVPAIVTEKS